MVYSLPTNHKAHTVTVLFALLFSAIEILAPGFLNWYLHTQSCSIYTVQYVCDPCNVLFVNDIAETASVV
jgi:hypothetical protein